MQTIKIMTYKNGKEVEKEFNVRPLLRFERKELLEKGCDLYGMTQEQIMLFVEFCVENILSKKQQEDFKYVSVTGEMEYVKALTQELAESIEEKNSSSGGSA